MPQNTRKSQQKKKRQQIAAGNTGTTQEISISGAARRTPDSELLAFRSEQYNGPLPHPDILKRYNDLHPELLNRVVCMAEEEGRTRREAERMLLEAQAAVIKSLPAEILRGQVFAFITAILFLGCGTTAILKGHDVAGASILHREHRNRYRRLCVRKVS
ncbi:MAG: DUF2335 domain-containing protein [Bryobacteraceae bacterium]